MRFGGGAFEGQYSASSRFEEGTGTNPEELIGAAHAGCFSMKFAGDLAKAGFAPTRVATTAKVTVEKHPDGSGFWISSVTLICEAEVPGIDKETLLKHAATAKENCPVSKALKGGPEIRAEVTLVQPARAR